LPEQTSSERRLAFLLSMIKDVVLVLSADPADDLRLAAAQTVAAQFGGRVIGLFFNTIPLLSVPIDAETGPGLIIKLLQDARAAGDVKQAVLTARLRKLSTPFEIRRYDVFSEDIADIVVREARTCDSVVSLRSDADGADPGNVIEALLFGCGRHLLVLPAGYLMIDPIRHAAIAWNGSREAARAIAEAMPILLAAEHVTILVVDERAPVEERALLGSDLAAHLRHYGIRATLHHIRMQAAGIGATLIAESQRLGADAIVMGGYGHSKSREWLLGGVTRELLHRAPIPLIIAH
jgi:nucleotide-binding universal stress UspA family protein